MRRLLVVIAVTLLVPVARAQSCHDASAEGSVAWVPVELLQRPVALQDGVGKVHETVTTQSAEAQAFYDQGLAYLHSYVWIEAARSFHQALRHDPKLAMAYVGLSRAYAGMYDLDAAARMSEAAAKLVDGVSARERAHVELRALRVASAMAPKDLEKLAAYRARLDRELSRHYDDLELWLLRGNIEDRVGAMGIGQYGNVSSIPFYEHVLSVDPEHFGAHHFLVHSFEGANRIDDALKHGAIYAAAAVNVPHAHHMYGHDLRRVGRTREAIERFETADRLHLAYFEREKLSPHLDWHHPHNLDLLSTSYQHQGDMKRAEELMRRSNALEPVSQRMAMQKKEWPVFLLSQGRVDEAAAAAQKMTESKYGGARVMGHLLLGQVALARNDLDAARRALAAAEAGLPKIDGPQVELVRGSLGPYTDKLRGAIALRSGDRERGRQLLKNVQESLRTLPGPDAWSQALFELESIATLARNAGDWELAEYTAQQMLEHDSAYGGSHLAAALVAEKKGDAAAVEKHRAQVRRYWGE